MEEKKRNKIVIQHKNRFFKEFKKSIIFAKLILIVEKKNVEKSPTNN
jgi:hypothetical protein